MMMKNCFNILFVLSILCSVGVYAHFSYLVYKEEKSIEKVCLMRLKNSDLITDTDVEFFMEECLLN